MAGQVGVAGKSLDRPDLAKYADASDAAVVRVTVEEPKATGETSRRPSP